PWAWAAISFKAFKHGVSMRRTADRSSTISRSAGSGFAPASCSARRTGSALPCHTVTVAIHTPSSGLFLRSTDLPAASFIRAPEEFLEFVNERQGGMGEQGRIVDRDLYQIRNRLLKLFLLNAQSGDGTRHGQLIEQFLDRRQQSRDFLFSGGSAQAQQIGD